MSGRFGLLLEGGRPRAAIRRAVSKAGGVLAGILPRPARGRDRAVRRRCRFPPRAVVARRPGHPCSAPRSTAPAGPGRGPPSAGLPLASPDARRWSTRSSPPEPAATSPTLVAIERIGAWANGGPAAYALRAATIFRRNRECGGPSTATTAATSRTRRSRCAGLSPMDVVAVRAGGH